MFKNANGDIMTFGYLLVISKNDNVDYLKLAYALALSIKNTQKEGYDKVALVTDDVESVKKLTSSWVFDTVIHWDQESHWNGRSWMDKLTPWDYTVCLDVDMLFFRDHSHYIHQLIEDSVELFLPSVTYTYRGDQVVSNEYRKTFTANKLPNLYSLFTFFKKDSDLSSNFFKLGRYIIRYPREFSNLYLHRNIPKVVGTDEAFALSAKILGIEDEITYQSEFPKVVHLKPMIQNWPWPADSVSDHVGFYFDVGAQLKIGNFQQQGIVHYVEKNLVTSETISILENMAWKK
jgi:hypothetical protein